MRDVECTERGFQVVRFKDLNGYDCSLQQSSVAGRADPGTSAIWLGMDSCPPMHLGLPLSPRMHLDRKQVKALVSLLQLWLRTGDLGKD